MFDLNKFVMDTLRGMVGNYPEFQVREFALNWYAKGKLTEEDLAMVESWFVEDEQLQDEQMNEMGG